MTKKAAADETEKSLVVQDRDLLFEQLREQYALSWEEQRNLIRSETPLNEKGVQLALRVARTFGLPLQGVNIINTKNGPQVYVNADGLRWRLHTDSRGIKRSEASITHRPTKDEPWFEATAIIEMGDGSIYTNIGCVYCLPGSQSAANDAMKSVTKSLRRAGIGAVGVALPIAEEYLEWVDEQRVAKSTIEGEFRDVSPQPSQKDPITLSELFLWAEQQSHTVDDVVSVVGDLSMAASDVGGALTKLKDAWKK